MLHCGLLGEKLGHSWSPVIHSMLGDYEYKLYEREPEELDSFLRNGTFDGLNVTIPYKKAVIPYCEELSPLAKKIGSVNTIVRRNDGTLYGENTDVAGFAGMMARGGISPTGKKALVLGSGGASVMAQAVLKELGAKEVVVISRSGENNYENLSLHADGQIIVNTTPVGMYPRNGFSPLDLTLFPQCEGVLDLVYNPARTALLLQAERLGIPAVGGLYMLVEQARCASELFTGTVIDKGVSIKIERTLARTMTNIVLVGMPGSGKGTVAAMLAEKLKRPMHDSDALVEEAGGMSIPQMFESFGEGYFRDRESEVLAKLGSCSGIVLATGGGSVLREENYDHLHQNGVIFWIRRDIERLPKDGRPISQRSDLKELYEKRKPRYQRFADYVVDNNGTVEETVNRILNILEEQ